MTRTITALLLAAGCSSTTILPPGEGDAGTESDEAATADAAGAETSNNDAATLDPCASCASTEWFCAGYVCDTRNCHVCESAACPSKPNCTALGPTFTFYTVWCCP